MTAVGYIRVSRVGGRGGDSFLSPELQWQSIERICQREGLELAEVFEELDKSGGDAGRPLWNRAIAMVESGEVGALVCWNLSRFSRSLKDALAAIERIEAGGGGCCPRRAPLGSWSGTSFYRSRRTTGTKPATRSSASGPARSSGGCTSPRSCRRATHATARRGG